MFSSSCQNYSDALPESSESYSDAIPESAETSERADTEDETDVEVPSELSELPFHHLNHLFS